MPAFECCSPPMVPTTRWWIAVFFNLNKIFGKSGVALHTIYMFLLQQKKWPFKSHEDSPGGAVWNKEIVCKNIAVCTHMANLKNVRVKYWDINNVFRQRSIMKRERTHLVIYDLLLRWNPPALFCMKTSPVISKWPTAAFLVLPVRGSTLSKTSQISWVKIELSCCTMAPVTFPNWPLPLSSLPLVQFSASSS